MVTTTNTNTDVREIKQANVFHTLRKNAATAPLAYESLFLIENYIDNEHYLLKFALSPYRAGGLSTYAQDLKKMLFSSKVENIDVTGMDNLINKINHAIFVSSIDNENIKELQEEVSSTAFTFNNITRLTDESVNFLLSKFPGSKISFLIENSNLTYISSDISKLKLSTSSLDQGISLIKVETKYLKIQDEDLIKVLSRYDDTKGLITINKPILSQYKQSSGIESPTKSDSSSDDNHDSAKENKPNVETIRREEKLATTTVKKKEGNCLVM